MKTYLDFEKPIAEFETKIGELQALNEPNGINIADEVATNPRAASVRLRAVERIKHTGAAA